MTSDARRIGLLAMVTPGSTMLWSSTRRHHDDQAIGGVVVSVDDSYDPETGESQRRYVTVDPTRGPEIITHVLAEDEIGQHGVEPVDFSTLTKLIRRLQARGAYPSTQGPGGRRRSNETGTATMLTTVGARYIGWQDLLAGVLFGATRLAPAGADQVPQDRGLRETSSPTTDEARPGMPVPLAAPPSLPAFTEADELLAGPEFRDAFLVAAKGLSAQEVAVIVSEATGGRYDATSGRPWKVGLGMIRKDEADAAMRRLQAALVTA